MPPHEPIITLSIQETGQAAQRVFLYHVRVDEEVIVSNQQLSAVASQLIRDISRQYNRLFEQRYAPNLAIESLQVLGAELFNTWLAPVWEQVTTKVPSGARRLLVIASDVADVLNLPWELMRPGRQDFLGFDAQIQHSPPAPARPTGSVCGHVAATPVAHPVYGLCTPGSGHP